MSYKIGIVGCGNVGVSYAFSLINQGIDIEEIVLIDLDEYLTEGKAFDLCHSLSFSKSYINKISVGKYEDISDADIVCITAGMPQGKSKESRMEDLKGADNIIENIMLQINSVKFSGIILVATNPLDVMTLKIARLYSNKYNEVIGSGTLIDTARLRYEIANKLDFPLKSISGYVFGEHGNSQFIAWSSVKVNNTYSIDTYLQENEKKEIEDNVKKAGFFVAKRQGYTCFAVANALVRITKAIIYDEKETLLPICTYDKEYDLYISSLSKIGREGVIDNKLYEFNEEEMLKYRQSVNTILEQINK